MEERRNKQRVQTTLEIMSSHSGVISKSRIRNISITGAFIQTKHPLDIDETFTIQLQLPGLAETMTIDVRVVWTKTESDAASTGMGIQFTNLRPDHKEKLAAFINQENQQDSSKQQATA